jgi:site-specific DNA recombinase
MSTAYAARTNTRSSQGLWALRAEPGPSFRWGAITRRSAYDRKKVVDESGKVTIERTEESTGRQEDTIYRYVERNGLGVIVHVYPEIVSAYDEKAKRIEYENALMDLRAGRIDGIIVWKLDRLTRRRSEKRRILNILEECGGRLYSIVEGLDTADPDKAKITEIALSLYVGSAEDESASISERVRLMHYDRARKGLVQRGSERPFGHTDDYRELVPAEVKVLHEAGERVLADESGLSIARDFTAREIPTTRGTTFWSSEVLLRMLRSPRMVGMREYGGELHDMHDVPPIFEREEWERIVAKLTHGPRPPTTQRMLTNLALCDGCLHPVRAGDGQAKGRRSRDPEEFSYRCRPAIKGVRDGACGHLWITGILADTEVSRRTIAYISNRENISRILLTYADKENLAKIQAREAELTESRAALFDARFTPPPGVPMLPEGVYYEKLKAIEDERRTLRRQLAVTREAHMLNEVLEMPDVAAEWEARPVSWRRAILKLVVATIIIERRGKGPSGQRAHLRKFDPSRIKVQFVGDAIE